MKRCVSLLLILIICLTAFNAALAERDFEGLKDRKILRQGDRGDAVKSLQQQLNKLGYLKAAPDGIFGEDTVDALRAFQLRNGFNGQSGFSGAATLFTQAALYGSDPVAADAQGSIGSVDAAAAQYGLRGVEVSTLNEASCSFYFTNEGTQTVTALCVIYWLADANDRVVPMNGNSYEFRVVHGLQLPPNGSCKIASKLPATQKELLRAGSLRFIISEIAYAGGAVYVDYNAAMQPFENDYFLAAKWS